MMSNLLSKLILIIIRFYQVCISPLLPARCRFYPTCSHYGKTAIQLHGTQRGCWLLLSRLCRCHPFGGSGIDFVPIPLDKFIYVPVIPSHFTVPANVSHETITINNAAYGYSYGKSSGWGIYIDRFSYRSFMNDMLPVD